jgi:flagellar assembly protein FliH
MTGALRIRLRGPLADVRATGCTPPEGAAVDGAPAGRGPEERRYAGLNAELAQQREQLAAAVGAMQAAVGRINDAREALLRGVEEQLLELAIDVAAKVLVQEIQAGRHEIEPIVREALEHVPQRTDVTVHLNPADLADCLPENLDDGELRLVADPSVPRAGCRLDTPQGVVESSPIGRLEDIAEALTEPE